MGDEMEWTDVGERVRRARLAAGISQSELGEAAGLDRTMVAKVESGRRKLDAFELARISTRLAVPMQFLLEPRPPVLSHRAVQLTEESETEVARRTERLDVTLASWIADIRQLVDLGVLTVRVPLSYPGTVATTEDARRAAMWLRQTLDLGTAPIDTLMGLCEAAGQLVLLTNTPGDGASAIDGEIAASVVSLTGDPGRRRSTAAHELGHLILGDEYSSDLSVHASRDEREAAIAAFASELLLPIEALVVGTSVPASREALIAFAARYRTSWSLALKQAERAGLIDAPQRRRLDQSKPTHVEFRDSVGWAPEPDLAKVRVPPTYAHAVVTAWREDLITTARAIELMHGQIRTEDLPARDDIDADP